MRFGLKTVLMGACLALSLVGHSRADLILSIGNTSVNATGGSFTVFATATGINETVSSYTLRLNLTATSVGELPVTFADGPGQAAGFTYSDFIPNNTIAALNGGTSGNSIGFSANTAGQPGPVLFAVGNTTAVGTFSFTTTGGFNLGDFIDVGIVQGGFDTQFANASALAIPLTVIGGTNDFGNNPTVATSTRIAIAVPEPSTFGLLGLVGVAFGMRRKRRHVSC